MLKVGSWNFGQSRRGEVAGPEPNSTLPLFPTARHTMEMAAMGAFGLGCVGVGLETKNSETGVLIPLVQTTQVRT